MRFGSVCSGIEAASVAWHPLGWRAAFVSEIEPFPSAVLAHHYPDVPNFGDMTKFKEWPDADVDVLVGGTPCQSFSVAGLRKGMADPRGNLALTFLAIADRYRPRWVVWENVPGVLSSLSHDAPDPSAPPAPLDLELDGQEVDTEDEYTAEELHALNCFVAGLSELGYGWSLRILDAQFAGVPQRRRRVFVVGCLGDWRRAAAVFLERHSLQGNPPPRRETGQRVAGTVKGGSGERGYPDPSDGNGGGLVHASEVSSTLRSGSTSEASHGKVNGTDRSEFVVMSSGQANAEITRDHAPTLNCLHEAPIVAHALRGEGFDASEDGTGRGTPLVPVAFREMNVALPVVEPLPFDTTQLTHPANHSNPKPGDPCHPLASGGHAPAIAFSTKDHGADAREETAPTLRAMGGVTANDAGGGSVAVAFQLNGDRQDPGVSTGEEVAFTLPANPMSDRGQAIAFEARIARNGRGGPSDVVPPLKAQSGETGKGDAAPLVAFNAYQRTVGDVHSPLTSEQKGRSETGIVNAMQVRRLTPRECERLQGFEDDYTLIPIGKKMAADGPRYKALGNSMAVPVMRWIGERIAQVDAIKDVEVAA